MSFKPGESGNPGGRPAGIRHLVRMAIDNDELVKILLGIARNTKASGKDRIAAIRELWDRAWGKPHQTHSIDGEIRGDGAADMTPEQRRARIREFLDALDDVKPSG